MLDHLMGGAAAERSDTRRGGFASVALGLHGTLLLSAGVVLAVVGAMALLTSTPRMG